MQTSDLRSNNQQFMEKIKQEETPDYFEKLQRGQAPEFFVLSCSDSRVSPSVITNMPLGHLFVHRNIANQVSGEDESFAASLTYALKYLAIKTILIKGHTHCGGIQAALADQADDEMQGWLAKIRGSLPDKVEAAASSMEELAKQNVRKQIEHLLAHPVYQKYGQDVEIVGCIFHVESGELERV